MAKSIIHDNNECYICGRYGQTQCHHIFYGRKNRQKSDDFGLTVRLCYECHQGPNGVHRNKHIDIYLKQKGQAEFEKTHSREEFRKIFGKNYL